MPAAFEVSRSGIGAHVWLFFTGPVAAATARRLGAGLLREAMALRGRMDLASYDRLFPSQDVLPASGSIGNLIARCRASVSSYRPIRPRSWSATENIGHVSVVGRAQVDDHGARNRWIACPSLLRDRGRVDDLPETQDPDAADVPNSAALTNSGLGPQDRSARSVVITVTVRDPIWQARGPGPSVETGTVPACEQHDDNQQKDQKSREKAHQTARRACSRSAGYVPGGDLFGHEGDSRGRNESSDKRLYPVPSSRIRTTSGCAIDGRSADASSNQVDQVRQPASVSET